MAHRRRNRRRFHGRHTVAAVAQSLGFFSTPVEVDERKIYRNVRSGESRSFSEWMGTGLVIASIHGMRGRALAVGIIAEYIRSGVLVPVNA